MAPDPVYGHKAYRQVQFESMTPGELILAVYDVAIRSCEERNMRRAGEAIVELMNGLDFTYQEIAGNLLVLYDYIYRRVREGAFDEAKRDLLDLREAWVKAVRATAPAERAGDEAQVTRIAG
jgi:flagellin-specific chaperone FliS